MEVHPVQSRFGAVLSGMVFLLMCCIAPAAGPLHASNDFTQKDSELLTHYYLRPVPDAVPAILERLTGSRYLSERLDSGNSLAGMAYLFARLARSEPSLLGRYEQVFEQAPHPGRVFLLDVFRLSGGTEIKAYLEPLAGDERFAGERHEIGQVLAGLPAGVDMLRKPPENEADLDMLWAEFMATGDGRAVERIIGVLDQPDATRTLVEQYLAAHKPARDDPVAAALKDWLGILCDQATGKVLTGRDLDVQLIFSSLNGGQPKEAVRTIRESLGMGDADYYRAAVKASAAWSLRSNALQHPKVVKVCLESLAGRSTRVKLTLLTVPASFHEEHLSIDEALQAYGRVAEEDPLDIEARQHLLRLHIEKRNLREAEQELAFFRNNGLTPDRKLAKGVEYLKLLLLDPGNMRDTGEDVNIPEILNRTVHRAEELKSYSSEMYVIQRPMPREISCLSLAKFELEYEKPDRFSVFQRMFMDDHTKPGYDRWITLGQDTYSRVRKWFREPALLRTRDKTNNLIRLEKWPELLVGNQVHDARCFESGGRRLYCLSFGVRHPGITLKEFGKDANARIWIEDGTFNILKSEISSWGHDPSGAEIEMVIEQVFADFDAVEAISPPREFTDLSGEEIKIAR